MSIYLKLPNVSGNATTKDYKDWIELNDIEFGGVHVPVTMTVGKQNDRLLKLPQFGQISALKFMDTSSIKLFEAAHSGTVFAEAQIHYVTTGATPMVYQKTKLSDVMISSYTEQLSEEHGHPEELIRLAYAKIERTFIPRNEKNEATSPLTSGFNLPTAEKM